MNVAAPVDVSVRPITCLNFDKSVRGSNGVYAVGISVSFVGSPISGRAAYIGGNNYVEIPYFENG